MNRHTPGPWIISNDTIGSNHGDIARLHYQSCRGLSSWHANAAVIAASPDLLTRLEESTRLLNAYRRREEDLGNAAQAEAIGRHVSRNSDVLRKAKGGSR